MEDMSNFTDIGNKSIDELIPEEKGKLLASIGTRKQQRPLDPVTVAEILAHTPSNTELARKLNITPRMVGMFKSLLSLPETVKLYVRSREISIDKAVRLAALDDTASQQFLARAIMADRDTFTAPTVTKIVALKNRNPDLSVEECVKKVLKSRPIVENRYVLITSIEKSLDETVASKAAEQGIPPADLLKGILRQSLPRDESLLSIVTHNGIVLLTLTAEGWQSLRHKAGSLGVPLDELVETLVKLSLKTGISK